MQMNISLRFWLILSFSTIVFIFLIVFFIFINSQVETEKLESYIYTLQNTRIALLETNKIKEDIFISELINPRFYEQNNSLQERKLNISFDKINKLIHTIKKSPITKDNSFLDEINHVERLLKGYSANFMELIHLYKIKGYKNYGLEGNMRNYAHQITDCSDSKIKYFSLLLRKHEKDFLIRKDLVYISSFNAVLRTLISYIFNESTYTAKEKNKLYNLAYFYNKYFKMIARIENKIGTKGHQGLLNSSNTIFEDLNSIIIQIEKQVEILELKRKNKIKQQSIVIFFLLLLSITIGIMLLTNAITGSVAKITHTFNNYISSGFSDIHNQHNRSHIKEFNIIYIHFLKMAKEINSYTNYFKEKVAERTLEINKQKEEIQLQQQKIELQYADLLKVNTDIINQRQLLKDKNKDMMESLKYAKRIQKALLPKSNVYNKYFKDNFVFTKAKDMVSGDFNLIYPFKTYKDINNEFIQQNNVFFIAADCTGHGVPGAFISVLGLNSINKLISLLNITDPGKLLDYLDSDINHFLSIDKKDRDLIFDGMDISAFSFNIDSYELNYCIAKFNCILIRNSEPIPLSNQNYSIGYNITPIHDKKFVTKTIQMQEGDCLYLLSDGFSDQFGGPLNKKYKRKSLHDLILNIHKLPMKEQKMILKKEHKDWKRHYSQTDDISIIGLKF